MNKLSDAFWLTLKIMIVLLIVRALLYFCQVQANVPLLDPLFFSVRDGVVWLGQTGARLTSGAISW